MSSRQHFDAAAFDPEAIRVMTIAFENALAILSLIDRIDPAIVARKIIGIARRGERDPTRLCRLALKDLSRTRLEQRRSEHRKKSRPEPAALPGS